MSVKKLLILTAAGVASLGVTAAMAGGPAMMAAPAPVESYFYVEGNVGYGFQDWSNQVHTGVLGTGTVLHTVAGDGQLGGLVYGADFGYMFDQYIGLELGWTYLPRWASNTGSNQYETNLYDGGSLYGFSVRNTGAAWGVLKLVAPLTEAFDLFFKGGVSYHYGSIVYEGISGDALFSPQTITMDEWRPVFAVGGTYNIDENWMASVSWMHIMGGHTYSVQGLPPAGISTSPSSLNVVTPATDIVMFSLGYKFTV